MMMGVSVNQLEKMVFLDNSAALAESSEAPEFIVTRFGKIALQRNKPILFPRGLLGMADKHCFFITNFPNEKFQKFKLLQSLDDHALAFITLPVELSNNVVAKEDLEFACNELGIKKENVVVLLIVSVHRSPEKISISVNARAPLLIDSARKLAAQYVFQNDKYKVQHFITA